MTLKKMAADFRTSLAAKISVGGTTGSIQNNYDDDNVVLPTGSYYFTLDADNSQKEHISATLTGVNLTDIKSVSRQGTETTGTVREHRIGASVSITDFAHILNHNKLLNGDDNLPNVMKNPAARVISDSRHLVDKEYADAISAAGIVAMLVTDAGGVTININSGTYLLNGAVKTYAGVAGQALTDDATNYIQITDGVLDIQTDAFDDDSIPLATVICASGDITSLVDNRPFYTGVDVKANYGLGRDANGIFIDLGTDPALEFVGGKLEAKVKTSGGITKDADGLSVDSTIYQTPLTMPAGEALSTGDFLKICNNASAANFYKIKGFNGSLGATTANDIEQNQVVQINSNKFAVVQTRTSDNSITVQVFSVSGNTITAGAIKVLFTPSSGVDGYGACIESIEADKFIVGYSTSDDSPASCINYAVVCTVSGTTVTVKTPLAVRTASYDLNPSSAKITPCSIKMMDTDKFLYVFLAASNGTLEWFGAYLTVSGDSVSSGTPLSLATTLPAPGNNFSTIAVLTTTTALVIYTDNNGANDFLPSVVLSVSGITLSAGSIVDIMPASFSAKSVSAVTISPTSVALFYQNAGTLTSLHYDLITITGTAIVATSQKIATSVLSNVQHTLSAVKYQELVYVYSATDKLIFKLKYTTTELIVVGSYAVPLSDTVYASVCAKNLMCVDTINQRLVLVSRYGYGANYGMQAQFGFPDWDEFCGSADANYLLAASVSLKRITAGQTGLIPGNTYGIAVNGTISPTITYPVGIAVSTTELYYKS